MTIEELYKIRRANDYKDMLGLRESKLIDWEVTKGEPPYVEEYLLTLDIPTYSERDTLFSPVKIRITLSEKYPMMSPIVQAAGTVPFHPDWYQPSVSHPFGLWSCGVYSPLEGLRPFCLRMIRSLLYDPTTLETYSPSNREATEWYIDNKDNIQLFPCDRQKLEEVKAIKPHLHMFKVVKSKA